MATYDKYLLTEKKFILGLHGMWKHQKIAIEIDCIDARLETNWYMHQMFGVCL